MSPGVRGAIGALAIALFVTPLHSVVVRALPACTWCAGISGVVQDEIFTLSVEEGLALAVADLVPPTTGFFDVDASRLQVGALGGTLVLEEGIVVPGNPQPSSTPASELAQVLSCEDCGGAQPAAQSSAAGFRIGFGFTLAAILGAILVAIAVPLFYLVRHLRSLEVEEAYLKERWGVRNRMD